MRKLLIPLLAALTLPTFAGDLGDADINTILVGIKIRKKDQNYLEVKVPMLLDVGISQ